VEDLTLGQSAERAHVVGEADITAFAAVSGDYNPVHMDETFAATSPFKGRIAHGMLAASYISALIGDELPGPGTVYLTQSLRFRHPVRIGDEVTTRVTVSAIDQARACVKLKTVCSVGEAVVLDGEALVMASRRGA
jgi:3-hydroxybutyryl-CoA dehydratase